MKEIFKAPKTSKSGAYKTIAKSKMKKDELLNYYEQLKYIRGLKSSTVKGWKEQRKQWREEAKAEDIPVDEIDENYDELMDNIDSKPWQEIAGYYYDSEVLNAIKWMEAGEGFSYLMSWCKSVEAEYKEEFVEYVKISDILTRDNMDEVLNEIWKSRSF